MSKSKNYNSIVFLTTLSVYLGLVLVGAPPAVLAQAALTQKIEIQNEAEIKDDLDKKPDEATATPSGFDDEFVEQYAKVILAILKLGYNPAQKDYEINIKASGVLSEEDFDTFFPTIKKELSVGDFNYELDKNKFVGNFSLKSRNGNENIFPFGSAFNASLNNFSQRSQENSEKVVLKNTQLTFKNNQIFIITHLPRASIDEILAKNTR